MLGIALVGQELDKASDRKRRWNRFRPSVALALQQDHPLGEVVYFYQPGQRPLAETILTDVRLRAEELGISFPSLALVQVKFPDPWSLDSTFAVLKSAIDEALATHQSAGSVCLHVNTGTHIMQMAMHIIVERQLTGAVRSQLIQTRPGTDGPDKAHRNTAGAKARILNLSYDPYPSIRGAIDVQRLSGRTEMLGAAETANPVLDQQIDELIDLSSRTSEPILLLGETGTGKTRIATRIHSLWSQSMKKGDDAPFKDVNCAGLDTGTLESELFGHVKGAFTGAVRDKIGMLEAADGGTLFLDEIGDMSLKVQGSLLKAIENKTFYPVGSEDQKESDFRLVCATNRSLDQLVQEGRFRLDLYARIRGWSYRLPPLRERSGDIPVLVNRMLRDWAEVYPRPTVRFIPEALRAYLAFAQSPQAVWTGNLRDLQQSVSRLATRASLREPMVIDTVLVDAEVAQLTAMWNAATSTTPSADADIFSMLLRWARENEPSRPLLDAAEALLQMEALRHFGGEKAKAARCLYRPPGAVPRRNDTATFNQRSVRLERRQD